MTTQWGAGWRRVYPLKRWRHTPYLATMLPVLSPHHAPVVKAFTHDRPGPVCFVSSNYLTPAVCSLFFLNGKQLWSRIATIIPVCSRSWLKGELFPLIGGWIVSPWWSGSGSHSVRQTGKPTCPSLHLNPNSLQIIKVTKPLTPVVPTTPIKTLPTAGTSTITHLTVTKADSQAKVRHFRFGWVNKLKLRVRQAWAARHSTFLSLVLL